MNMKHTNGEISDSTAIAGTEILSPKIAGTEYDSEYCHVQYLESTHAVFLTWKKFASFDNYRKPTRFALALMQNLPATRFIVDARNGFEDEKADVE
jgi:hypothetical protein